LDLYPNLSVDNIIGMLAMTWTTKIVSVVVVDFVDFDFGLVFDFVLDFDSDFGIAIVYHWCLY